MAGTATGNDRGNGGGNGGGNGNGGGGAGFQLPLYYKSLAPLTPEQHGALGLVQERHFRFAGERNVVPLTAIEFGQAQKHYPILFHPDPPHQPVALVGLEAGRNSLLDAEGGWRPGRYVPAYVRRYPFALMPTGKNSEMTLAIDETSDLLSEDGEDKLFVDGAPSALTRAMLDFCKEFESQIRATRSFGERLAELKVLQPTTLNLGSADRPAKVEGYLTVSETKLGQLDDAAYLSLKPNGYLGVIYAHLLSIAGPKSISDPRRGLAPKG